MKIDGINPAGKPGDAPKKTEKTTGGAFDAFLKNAMETAKPGAGAPAGGPAPVMPPAMLFQTPKNPFSAEALKQLDATLDDLEMYRNALASGDIPLKRLKPMADALMARKDGLVGLMSRVDDPKLKELLSTTATTILDENSRLHAAA